MKRPALDVVEHQCANGLQVLLLERTPAPVVCVSIWYRVGSRDDPPGQAGMAHLLEHMLYKGTRRHPKGAFDRILHRLGAVNNASTWLDRTHYYILAGREHLESALALEADRMQNACLDAADLRDEIRVVCNEIERNDDDPATALYERLLGFALPDHPYGRPVAGSRETVRTIRTADLQAFYQRYYQPANALCVLAGDFRAPRAIAAVERTFGPLPGGEAPARVAEPRRPQRGERRFEVRQTVPIELLAAAYQAPGGDHRDRHALDLLAHLLGHGRTARLYAALVEQDLAVQVSAEHVAAPRDPFLFFIDLELPRKPRIAALEAALDGEIARLQEEPVAAAELARAHKQARVAFLLRRERVSALAELVGETAAVRDWRTLRDYLPRLEAVTPEDLCRVARRYLVSARRTLGRCRPGRAGSGVSAAGGGAP